MILAGRRFYPAGLQAPVLSFAFALLLSTLSILSIGFVIASVVRTARFAQPVSALIFYPMIGLSGLFVPVAALPSGLQWFAKMLPMTYIVSLLGGIWSGEPWSAHLGDLAALGDRRGGVHGGIRPRLSLGVSRAQPVACQPFRQIWCLKPRSKPDAPQPVRRSY